MDDHDDDSRSLTVLPADEEYLVPISDTFGVWPRIKKQGKPEYAYKSPSVIPNLTEKELSLLNFYKRIGLTTKQKRDLHVLLIRMSSVKDLIDVSKEIFNDVKHTICCPDKRCLCDPTHQFRISTKYAYQNHVGKRTFGKAVDDFEIEKLAELKNTENELIKINKELIKLRGIIKHEDEDLNNFVELLLFKDVQQNKEKLHYLEEKLRRSYM